MDNYLDNRSEVDVDSIRVQYSREQPSVEESKENSSNITSKNQEGSDESKKSEYQNMKEKLKKTSSDGSEENCKNNLQSVLDKSKSSLNIKNICYKCNASVDIIELECKHSLCDPCLSNMVELQCSKDSVYILKCICEKVIKSKIFEGIVLSDTLFEYLDRLNSYKIKHFSDADCPVCGHNHIKETKCSNYFKNTQGIQACSCGKPGEHLLNCNHFYCNKCLMEVIMETWDEDPNSYIQCKPCRPTETIVPLSIIEKCFGSSKKYQKMKKDLAECKICFKIFDTKIFTSLGCKHRFCNECIKQFIENKIMTMIGHEIKCPDCEIEIEQKIIKAIIDSKLYEKYINTSLIRNKVQKNKKDDDKILWCSYCKIDYKASAESNYRCPDCKKKNNYKPGNIPENVIQCPYCENGIIRDNGCNFIQCGWKLCGVYFCALCKKQLKIHQHQSHYKSSGPFSDTCNKLDRKSKNK